MTDAPAKSSTPRRTSALALLGWAALGLSTWVLMLALDAVGPARAGPRIYAVGEHLMLFNVALNWVLWIPFAWAVSARADVGRWERGLIMAAIIAPTVGGCWFLSLSFVFDQIRAFFSLWG